MGAVGEHEGESETAVDQRRGPVRLSAACGMNGYQQRRIALLCRSLRGLAGPLPQHAVHSANYIQQHSHYCFRGSEPEKYSSPYICTLCAEKSDDVPNKVLSTSTSEDTHPVASGSPESSHANSVIVVTTGARVVTVLVKVLEVLVLGMSV